MGFIVAVFSFLWTALKKIGGIFSTIPAKLAVVVSGISAVVAEIATFVEEIGAWFSNMMANLETAFSDLSTSSILDSPVFQMISYSLSLDVLVTMLAEVAAVVLSIITFIFVTFVHIVLIFFGLRFGYRTYKYLVTSFTNGISKA